MKHYVAKKLPFNKDAGIDVLSDNFYKLMASGKFEGYLPKQGENPKTFKIDYEKTQKIDFIQSLIDVLGVKEGLSVPMVVSLMKWSINENCNLKYQSVIAFPFNQLEGVFIDVIYDVKTEPGAAGKIAAVNEYIELDENNRYTQHLLIPVLKSLYNFPYGIPSSYEARVGGFTNANFGILPSEIIQGYAKRFSGFPDLNIGEQNGNQNILVPTAILDIIGKKVSLVMKNEPNFQDQLISTNQEFIKLFGFDADPLENETVREKFINHGLQNGAYSVRIEYLTDEFIEKICQAEAARVSDRRNYMRNGAVDEERFNKANSYLPENISKYRKWADTKKRGFTENKSVKADYSPDSESFANYKKQQEEILKAKKEAKAKSKDGENTGNDMPVGDEDF